MKKIISLLFLLCFNFAYLIPTNISIRNATQEDLSAIVDLDKVVLYEYFLPLYAQECAHLPLGKNPVYFLELALESDKKWFPECVNGNAESIWVAYDQDKNKLAGLIVADQASFAKIEIGLILILKEYRRKGIGKALIYHAIDSFPAAATCEVHPFQFDDVALAFYKAIGFVNQGISTIDEINIYGIHYKDMYYHFTYDIAAQSQQIK